MIALIDYRAGNLTSVRKAFATLGAELYDPVSPRDLDRARAIVVPGVGHFAATRALDGEWIHAIRAHVTAGRPLLGICLGLQWLFEGSDEAAECRGLGLLRGTCYRLKGNGGLKVPHVGWNSLDITREAAIVRSVPSGSQVYFTHSFVAPVTDDTAAVTEHGEPFAAIVERGNVAGVQFHPEKSGDVGLQILRNFIDAV
ncbi:MAG: imidazole glycerol phosphate synthase subunit HisH [Vicinamibacterales bacterium]